MRLTGSSRTGSEGHSHTVLLGCTSAFFPQSVHLDEGSYGCAHCKAGPEGEQECCHWAAEHW